MMMANDNQMVCNFRKCRRRVNTWAWVTSCSHIFCDEDGAREFNKSNTCPACETRLPGKYDILKIDLQLSEQYISMLLAGQKPETVIEVCSRAISFWTYQSDQERAYQEFIANKAKERNVQLEQYYEQVIMRAQTELNSLKAEVSASKKNLEATRKKYSEVSSKLLEKTRQCQKLQASTSDALCPRCVHQQMDPSLRRYCSSSNLAMPTFGRGKPDVLRLCHATPETERNSVIMSERDFVFRPAPTPVLGSGDAATFSRSFLSHFGTPGSLRQQDHRQHT